MRTQIFTKITVTIFLMLMSVVFTSAQELKTVTDFYLALPNDRYHPYTENGTAITGKTAVTKYRKSLITTEDIPNGYIKLENNSMEGWTEFTLFKKSDGSYIFAVSEISCGPACDGELRLLTFNDGKWLDVTKQFAPKLPQAALTDDLESYWKLPRAGKTLIFVNTDEDVRDESKKLVYKEFKFEWNGTRFIGK